MDVAMDDEEYARELFAILTRPPEPDLAPGHLGDDFIDRGDGFGTEVRVRSIGVVPGEHGAQIEVGFVLAVPDGVDVPAEGSLLLPLDAEWREVSGFADPEDYAPVVAMRLMHNVHHHVRAHDRRPRRSVELPSRHAQHAMLLEVLGRSGEVEQPGPDRYVVRLSDDLDDPDDPGDLVALLTADQWEQALERHGIPQDGAFDHYEELIASRGRGERFLVFWEGDLLTSIREELPPASRPRTPLREIRRNLAEAKASGKDYGWFAHSSGRDRS